MSAPCLRFYKDENLTKAQLGRLNELWTLFQDDSPKWISRQECLMLKNAENFIFVFPTFEGQAFEFVRALSNAKIISAHCMLSSIKSQKKLPRTVIPAYSFSMEKLIVCCTNIEKKLRQEIYDKVEMMRGKTSKIFTDSVTHLVTTEVGSAKYQAAAQMNVPVMLPDWVIKVWEASSEEDVHATDARFLQYSCPLFNNFVVCASGLPESVRQDLKRLVESNGGTYSGDLVCGTTTHLVANEPTGNKYIHAKSWKVKVVKFAWVTDSVKAKYCMEEKKYELEDTNSSTPTLDVNTSANVDGRISATNLNNTTRLAGNMNTSLNTSSGGGGARFNTTPSLAKNMHQHQMGKQQQKMLPPDMDISVINKNNSNKLLMNLSNSTINQPYDGPNSSMLNSTAIGAACTPKTLTKYPSILKELNSVMKTKLTLFDGINIYFESFEETGVNERLKKLADAGGATRYESPSSDVSHIVVNILNEKQCKHYVELNPGMNIVNVDWFIDSCKDNQLTDCKPYFVYSNALNSVKTPKKRARPEKSTPTIGLSLAKSDTLTDSDLNACLSQYLNADSAAMMKQKQQAQGIAVNQPAALSAQKPAPPPKPAPPVIPTSCVPNELFSNMKFQIVGFDESETSHLEGVLAKKGAIVINEELRQYTDVDFTLFPITIPDSLPASAEYTPVTIYWMRKCMEKNILFSDRDDLEDDLYFQPIPRRNSAAKPLSNCVITISGFNQMEKDTFSTLAKILGAHVQQQLSLQQTETIRVNTHLISKQSNGPKYQAAKNWRMPVVNADWLIETCLSGAKACEADFSIEPADKEKTLQFKKDLHARLEQLRKLPKETSPPPRPSNNSLVSKHSTSKNLTDSFSNSMLSNTAKKLIDGHQLNHDDSTKLERTHHQSEETFFDVQQPNESRRLEAENLSSNGIEEDVSLSEAPDSFKRRKLDGGEPDQDETEIDDVEALNNMSTSRIKSDQQNLSINRRRIQSPGPNRFSGADNSGEDDQLILGAIENRNPNTDFAAAAEKPQVLVSANAARNGIASNPRLKEIRQSEFYSSPQNRSSNQHHQPQSPNHQTTPVWLRPSDQVDQQALLAGYKLSSFDSENIMENFKTPEAIALAKRAASRQKEETPLGVVFARNLHEANENSKMQSFYTNYNPSPVIQFSYNHNNNNQQQQHQDFYGNEKENQQYQTTTSNRRPPPAFQKQTTEYVDKNGDCVEDETSYEQENAATDAAAKPEIPDSMDMKISLLDKLQDQLASLRNSNTSSASIGSGSNTLNNTSQNLSSNSHNNVNKKLIGKAASSSNNNDCEPDENHDEDLMANNKNNMAPMSSQIQMTIWKEDHHQVGAAMPLAAAAGGGVSTRLRGFRSGAKLNN